MRHLLFVYVFYNYLKYNGLSYLRVFAQYESYTQESSHNPYFIYIAYLPAIIFWILDGYFLSQERLYRDLYNHVRKLKDEEVDFSMDIKKFQKNERNSWRSSMISKTVLILYVPLLLMMIMLTIILSRQ
jgi:hypothetical protein